MKTEIRLILMTYSLKENAVFVLLDREAVPQKRLIDSPKAEIDKLSLKYIKTEPQFIDYDICGYTYDKDSKTLALYFYTFIPSPVPVKKGTWHKAWEVYRNPEDEEIFDVIQAAATKAFRRVQSGLSEF